MASWSKPSSHVLKANCKGMFDRSSMSGSVGCVLRNSRGIWVKGVVGVIGLCVPLSAELWAIYYALKLAWENGVKHVVIESECEEAVNEVNNPTEGFWFADMVVLIKNIEREAWESCVVVHVSAEANVAARTLAASELLGEGGIKELAAAPAFLQSTLATDSA